MRHLHYWQTVRPTPLESHLGEVRFVARADEKTDLAAKLLRILYIKDLRALQTQIDEIIVQIQVHFLPSNLCV